jgi:histidyl-tRNA synthetase
MEQVQVLDLQAVLVVVLVTQKDQELAEQELQVKEMQEAMEHHHLPDQEVVQAAAVRDHLVQMEHHLMAEMAEMELFHHILVHQ